MLFWSRHAASLQVKKKELKRGGGVKEYWEHRKRAEE